MDKKIFLKYHFPVILMCLVIFVLSSIPGNYYPKVDFKFSDKIVHIILYSALSSAFYISIRKQNKVGLFSEHAFIFSIVLSALYGISDEFHQYFVPNRSCDVYDMIANTIGATIAITIIYLYLKFRKKEKFERI